MASFTPAQIQSALRSAGFNRTPTAQDIANAQKYGLGIFGKTASRITSQAGPTGQPAPQGMAPTQSEPTTTDPGAAYLEQVRALLTPQSARPNVTPFDQSGFYNEGDARALAGQEYDPYYQKLGAEQTARNTEDDRQRLEQVNAAGGTQSSAYGKEMDLRRLALQRAGQEQTDQQRFAKEGFVQNRRQDAYNRYLQSIGSMTTT